MPEHDRGILVEHDIDIVLDLWQRIYVLELGRPLMDGTPEDVAASPSVREAYLGSLSLTP